MPRVLIVDERAVRHDDAGADALRARGFDVTTTAAAEKDAIHAIDAIVVSLDGTSPGLPPCSRSDAARAVPVVVAAGEGVTPEAALRLAIDGAVCCVDAADPDAIAAALDAVLAPGAPPLREQRRRARVAALEALARSSSGQRAAPSTATRVHLTRLEHRPVRPEPSEPRPAPPLPCTARQRELLDAIVREGSVGRAAAARGTSRSSVYAALRRIARRLQLRDTAEVLRAIGVHDAGEYRSQLESARS